MVFEGMFMRCKLCDWEPNPRNRIRYNKERALRSHLLIVHNITGVKEREISKFIPKEIRRCSYCHEPMRQSKRKEYYYCHYCEPVFRRINEGESCRI